MGRLKWVKIRLPRWLLVPVRRGGKPPFGMAEVGQGTSCLDEAQASLGLIDGHDIARLSMIHGPPGDMDHVGFPFASAQQRQQGPRSRRYVLEPADQGGWKITATIGRTGQDRVKFRRHERFHGF